MTTDAIETDLDRDDRERRILVVDDESSARLALMTLLREDGYQVREAPDGFKAMGIVREWDPDVVLTDVRMPLMDGLELLRAVRELRPSIATIVMTAHGSIEMAVDAMKNGADDFLTKPLNFDAVELIIERAFGRQALKRELSALRHQLAVSESPEIVGCSPALTDLLRMTDQVAASTATILVTGESGTGKELIARRLHARSGRAGGPFMTIHCASLPESLLESELFGHEKGAFTGATTERRARFEEADGGTVFLDEIGELSPTIQVKLLRFLQTHEFEHVGGNRTLTVDVRILAATNRDLAAEVRAGRFREDLYYRLNVIELEMPPLRARRTDIPILIRHFVAFYAAQNNRTIESVDPDAMIALEAWDWPGNVRELENTIERAVVLCNGGTITRQHLPRELKNVFGSDTETEPRVPGSTLAEVERFVIIETYRSTGGSTSETAAILDISQRKVQYKLNEYRANGDQAISG